ncbi:GntR family transcriptional regulator [Alicyclobacillus fodiniaquatilis]|uniref:GntR family transcriptional regulator n=1 Tax=Alicyclobacillus fodiniaquatilis TaxID=1661150 RepID=A0ABW4JG60_9BACL
MATPLYEQLYTYIIEQIRDGKLQKGDRVPSEKEFAEQFSVSRITSKKALEMLAQANVIERVRGKGSFVSLDTDRSAPINLPNAVEDNSSENKHSWVLGVIFPDCSDSFGTRMLRAIEEQCAKSNCHMILKFTYDSQTIEEQAVQSLVRYGVDGLIILPVHGEMYNAELLRLSLDNFPMILVDRHLKGIPVQSVHTDNAKAAEELTDFLLDRGHQHIGFLSPPPEHTTVIEERVQGFITAFSKRGLNINLGYLERRLMSTLPSRQTMPEEVNADKRLLTQFIQEHENITAFVACEYNIALLLSKVLASMQKKIPRDVEVVCFDSLDRPFDSPFFTHIRQNEEAIGKTAVNKLLKQLEGKQTSINCTIGYELIMGESTHINLG